MFADMKPESNQMWGTREPGAHDCPTEGMECGYHSQLPQEGLTGTSVKPSYYKLLERKHVMVLLELVLCC